MESHIRRSMSSARAMISSSSWRPPGLNKADLDIRVKDNALHIAGTKSVAYGEEVGLHRRERSAGRFNRAVTIPVQIDAERVRAEYKDGILALYLPRAEQDKPRSIKIS